MRFIIDECTGPSVALWLRKQGYEVFSVYEDARGMTDEQIIGMAYNNNWILVTNDKDFGEQIFKRGHLHKGVILLRLKDERAASKISVISRLLNHYKERLSCTFVIATEEQVRFARK
jgi:predicted nuclease of predicted toxin-antitoxin system